MKTDTTPDDAPASVIDTSKMSPEQRAALELTEAAREASRDTFAGGLFLGRFDLSALHPFPRQNHEDRDQGDAFLARLENFLRSETDPDTLDATGEIPQSVFDGLPNLGALGRKVPTQYAAP